MAPDLPEQVQSWVDQARLIRADIRDDDIVSHFALMARVAGVEALDIWIEYLRSAALAEAQMSAPPKWMRPWPWTLPDDTRGDPPGSIGSGHDASRAQPRRDR